MSDREAWQIAREQAYKLGQIEGVLALDISDAEKVRKIRRLLDPTWTDTGSGPGSPS